jgi:hypothetical protein
MTEIPEAGLRARQRYLAREKVQTICKDEKLSLDQFYYWMDGAPQPDGGKLLPPIPRRRIIVRKSSRAGTRIALITRMMRATELQLHEIEQRLGEKKGEPGGRERDARMMTILAKTLRELIALDDENAPRDAPTKPASSEDDFVPRDVDELRRELARRVDILRQGRIAAGSTGDV